MTYKTYTKLDMKQMINWMKGTSSLSFPMAIRKSGSEDVEILRWQSKQRAD